MSNVFEATPAKSLQAAAQQCLLTANAQEKIKRTLSVRELWCQKEISLDKNHPVDKQCTVSLPEKPTLVAFNQLPKRSLTSQQGHAALIHSFAHIEFNAVNIAWDAVYRFLDMPDEFYDDWSRIAAEEAYHFQLLRDYLLTLGYDYGSFSAHASLWEMVEQTKDDVMIRMALVPRVLEARGLDVTPGIIQRFRQHKMDKAADILQIIYIDEIDHVAIGTKWFQVLCKQRGLESQATFEQLIEQYATDKIRQPFNTEARTQAGFSPQEMVYLNAFK